MPLFQAIAIFQMAPLFWAAAILSPPDSKQTKATLAAVARAPQLSGKPGEGLTVVIDDGFSLNVRSRLQLRYQLLVPPEDATDDHQPQQLVSIGTARIWLSGQVYSPALTYLIQLAVAGRDFRDGATSPIYDAYLDWRPHRDFNVQAGQYFVPFDRLRTVREWALQMSDRARPVLELTLDRDMGMTFYSNNFLGDQSPFAWRLSAFGGGGTNLSTGRDPGGLFVGRLEWRPLGPIKDDVDSDLERGDGPRLALGAAIANNVNSNRQRSTSGPTFKGGTTSYQHVAADLVFKWRGAMVQAEYLRKHAAADQISSVDESGVPRTEFTRSGNGAVLQASYLFAVHIETVARLSRMRAARGTDPAFVAEMQKRGDEGALGLNYYFNGHRMKVQATWVARMPRGFQLARAEHLSVVQLDATF